MKKLLLKSAFLITNILLISNIALSKSWTSRENWVTQYLKNGGKIEDVTGAVQPEGWQFRASWDDMHDVLDYETLPTHFDWNDYYQLQPVRNQGSCGSCWDFSTTAAFESAVRIAFPPSIQYDLSEQETLSCSRAGSCGGGYFDALDYMADNGLGKESDFPYTASNKACKNITPIAKLKEWHYIGTNGAKPTTAQIKAAIYNYGPVSVDVNATASFSSYGGGVFSGCASAASTNHMVVIDGWTDDPTYSSNGGGYWRMRNSWGIGFGDHGYMNIVYKSKSGTNCSGIGNVAAYVIVDGLPRDDQ